MLHRLGTASQREEGRGETSCKEMEKMFERILLSVDGSEDSDKAVRATRDLARLHGSEVFVVHGRDLAIVAPPSPLPSGQGGAEDEAESRLLVDMAVAELRSGEVRASGRTSRPASAL